MAALPMLFMLHNNSMGSVPLFIFPLCEDMRILSIERFSILPELVFKPRQADSEPMLTSVSLVGGGGHDVYLRVCNILGRNVIWKMWLYSLFARVRK